MSDKLKLTIDELNLCNRSKNALFRSGYKTLRDIVASTKGEILRSPGLGEKAFREINAEVVRQGFAIGMFLPEEMPA